MKRSLRETEKPSIRKYKHYKTSFNHVKEPNFIYIGMNLEKIPDLISVLGGGIPVKNVEEAISTLKILLEGNIIPKVIFIGGEIELSSVKTLNDYISSNVQYSLTLFILDASQLPATGLTRFRRSGMFDEIMFLDEINKKKLISDIGFLKQIKSKGLRHLNPEITMGTSQQVINFRIISKRVFDFVVSLLLIILCSPLFLLIALLIKLESYGPVLYIAPRAGQGFQVFNFYKFRTMEVGADEKIAGLTHLNQYNGHSDKNPAFFKICNDPRVTRLGTILRNTSLDELPQLFNVLFGDMSLVGNRPLPTYEAATLTTDEWAVRFLAPAGITGLWQIKKRGQSSMSVEERMKLDIEYANNNSFLLDIWIILNTPFVLLQKTSV
jgi:lipopolysaccharide/colanic/teichoic acid biosynthesis glycosyltransferase